MLELWNNILLASSTIQFNGSLAEPHQGISCGIRISQGGGRKLAKIRKNGNFKFIHTLKRITTFIYLWNIFFLIAIKIILRYVFVKSQEKNFN